MEDLFRLENTTIDGKYRVDKVVGEGGFGVVYRGWRPSFDDAVAIKCLKIPHDFSEEARRRFLERFREEGKLLARLSKAHLSIVQVYDSGVFQNSSGATVPYLVLEWLEGRDLGRVLRDRGKPFSQAEAVTLLRPAMEAIAVAHGMRIAHRDLKPANLFLVRSDAGPRVKVLDFGIAKAMQEGESAAQQSTRTSSSFSAFSPTYGAPEQFQYAPTGPWTDVHALALILVELITGRTPLDGRHQFELFTSAVSTQRPTPRTRGAEVNEAFEAACSRALSLDPKVRQADAGELLRELLAACGRELDSASALLEELCASDEIVPRPSEIARAPTVTSQTPNEPDAVGASQPTIAGPGSPDPRQAPTAQDIASAPTQPSGRPVVREPSALIPAQDAPAITGPATTMPAATLVKKSRLGLIVGIGAAVILLGAGAAFAGLGGLFLVARTAPPPPPPVSRDQPVAIAPSAQPPAHLLAVPGGTFNLGFAEGPESERPVVRTTVAGFQLEDTETTVGMYRGCVQAGRCTEAGTGPLCNWNQEGREQHPINCVDWNQAVAYCAWAGRRLPTEQEWEYAARGTDGRRFPWGNQFGDARACTANGAKGSGTCAVGSFRTGSNAFGHQDLVGNVWEWTASPGCSYSEPSCDSPTKVLRGGSFLDKDPSFLRATSRLLRPPSTRVNNFGFRCAR